MTTSRFYFRFTTPADVSPAFDAAWTNVATALRRRLAPERLASDTIAVGDNRTWTAGQLRLDRQYVGDPMVAGVDFTGGICRMLARTSEDNTDNNSVTRLGIRVVDVAGTIVRATLLAVGNHGGDAELPSPTATTQRWANDAALAAYVTKHGDRLVVEVGFTDLSGTTPQALALYGSSGADDHSSVGSSSGFNPWIDFTTTIPGLTAASGRINALTVTPHTLGGLC